MNGSGASGNSARAACSPPPCRAGGTDPAPSPVLQAGNEFWECFAIADTLIVAAGALATDALFGYPDRLFRLAGHPVSWIGAGIARLDRLLNRDTMPEPRRRICGMLALLLLAGVPTLVAAGLQRAATLLPRPAALGLLALAAGTLVAQRSLWQHVRAVLHGLERQGLTGGRLAVSRIVGRDPDTLDAVGVARAAIESLAENFSDGVVAPLLWCAAFGLPGIVFYKAVNTADSMIGHLSPRHRAFGWASARLDDLVNLPASRLAALWLVCAALVSRDADARAAAAAVRRDAGRHRSPNAGWPEAAMAGALGLRLAGPRVYAGHRVADPWLGDGRVDAGPAELRRALALYFRACLIEAAALSLLAAMALRGSPA